MSKILQKLSSITPMGSVLQNAECEIIAQNILKILQRTTNSFRKLTWEEYKEERLKDGNFSEVEKGIFNKVVEYTENEQQCAFFSKAWA